MNYVTGSIDISPKTKICRRGGYAIFNCSGGRGSYYSWKRNNISLQLSSDDHNVINVNILNISCQYDSMIECLDESGDGAIAQLVIQGN